MILTFSKRYGPEFSDPARGEFIPEFVTLDRAPLDAIRFKTPELRDWMRRHIDYLRSIRLATSGISRLLTVLQKSRFSLPASGVNIR